MPLPKIVIFASSCMSLPVIGYLLQRENLAGVVVSLSKEPQRNADTQQLIANLQQMSVPFIQYQMESLDALQTQLSQWKVEWGIVFTFPEILPQTLINSFEGQLFNMHASDLPNYRGSMPVYWQLRHNLDEIKLTLHRIEEKVDTGEIGHQIPIYIHPFDNFQTLNFKVMEHAPQLINELLDLDSKGELYWKPQRELSENDFHARDVSASDQYMYWDKHSADEFVGAARAANPHHGGVTVNSQLGQFQVMQITKSKQPCFGVKPGTVLMVDKYKGWVVATKEGAISLDVIISQNGYFSGYQFAIRFDIEAGSKLL